MGIKIRCLKCNKSYLCYTENTRIHGPTLETTCPECGHFLIKNYSSFIEEQIGYDVGNLEKTVLMIRMAQLLNGLLNADKKSFRNKRNS